MVDDVTVGEVFRRLIDMDERHSAQLTSIESQARLTNGRVARSETRLDWHDGELRELKRNITHHPSRRTSDRANAITLNIPTSKTTLTILITVVGGIVAASFTAAAKLFGLL